MCKLGSDPILSGSMDGVALYNVRRVLVLDGLDSNTSSIGELGTAVEKLDILNMDRSGYSGFAI